MASVRRSGITPAYAGKRLPIFGKERGAEDHPRVCGEKPRSSAHTRPAKGSPPRMRGKASSRRRIGAAVGITPAYAGKSLSLETLGTTSRGSPPRMRGKVLSPCRSGRFPGITPAYAGKSWIFAVSAFWLWDHPRVCGEKHEPARAQGLIMGSPPRMRGKVMLLPLLVVLPGITPAYAGKSCTVNSGYRTPRDHPRVCGEKYTCAALCARVLGSPPRMRGKGVQPRDKRVGMRITPAYAGKRRRVPAKLAASRDHPRVCGEKLCPVSRVMHTKGSPPRMRGKEFRVE